MVSGPDKRGYRKVTHYHCFGPFDKGVSLV